MKLLLTALCIALSALALAQNDHPIPQSKWLKDFFLSDEFCASKGLQPGEIRQSFRVWNYKEVDNRIQRVVDVRWYLSSPAEAVAYLNENYARMSERGVPISTKITIPQAENVMAFRESDGTRKLNRDLGIKMNMYYFLFTVKNYVAKVFISSEKDISIDEALAFANEAARRLNAAAK